MPEGRAAAAAEINDAITRGSGSFVVAGDAGIGKSTLLADVITSAKRLHLAVVTTRWSGDADMAPMWPWSVLVRNWVTEIGSVDALGEAHPLVRRLVPDLVEGRFDVPDAASDEVAGRLALGDGLGRLIARSHRPVLVVLEDLHHAPVGGLGMLEPFATAALTGNVVIAASTRDLASAAGLTAVPATRRISLTPLTDAEAAVVARNIEPSLDEAAVASVVMRAEGNPFFIAELARLAAADDDTATTQAVRDVVLRRVDALGDGARDVLGLAALIGRKPKLDLLYAVVGDDALVDHVLDAAEASRLVEIDGKQMRWNHDLVRESLTDALRSNAKRRLHARIADALGASKAADTLQLAHHFLASGATDDRVVDLGTTAAQEASDNGAHEGAVHWADLTLEVLEATPERRDRIGRLHYIAGRSLVALQRYDEGKKRLVISARLALDRNDPTAAAAALMTVGSERLKGLPDYEPPLDMVNEVLERLVDDPVWTCRLIGRKADLVADPAEFKRLSGQAVELARELDDPNLLVTALGRVLILWHDLVVDEYEARLAEIQAAAVTAEPERQFEANAFAVLIKMVMGDLDAASELVPIINASVLRLGIPRGLAFHTASACIHLMQGRFDQALDVMNDHVASTEGVAALEALAARGALQGVISILKGDFTEFMESAQMFLAMTAGQPTAIRVHPFVALAGQLAGEHELAHNSIDEAFRIGFEGIFEWVFGLGTPLAMLMTEALCAYGDDRVIALEERLRRFSGRMPVGGMAPALVFGAVDHQLALIARLRGDDAEARRLIDAAIALHRKMGAHPFVARSLFVSAEIADAAGDVERTTADAREAARLAARYEMRQVAEWSAALLAKHGAAPVKGARVTGPSTAIVFTDIESSTASAAALGDAAWFDRLRDHDTTVRKLVAQHGGREVKHLGDGFMLTFPTAHAAVDFGASLQRAFTDALVRVRAGVHVGPVIEEDNDIFGTTVNVAARVSAAANGGETLISEDVIALVGDASVAGPRVATLKGVAEPMKLYALTG